MSLIKMSYIIIRKGKDNADLEGIILSYLKSTGFEFNDEGFHIGSDLISCSIKHRKYSERWYLEFSSSMRVNRGIEALQKLDDSLFKSDFGKYAESLRAYDGISECICESLYKKCSMFERRIRQLILLVLTKSFGRAWRDETFPEELLNAVKMNAKGRLSLTDTLEQFDLYHLERYLFDKDESKTQLILTDNLSKENLKEMSKEEICSLIEKMRPISLWDEFFYKYGTSEEWEKKLKEIQEVRNKISHHKHITLEERSLFVPKINKVNKDLLGAIEEIKQEDFTNESAIVALGKFAKMFFELGKAFAARYDYSNLLTGINNSIMKLSSHLSDIYLRTYTENLENAIQNSLDITSSALNLPDFFMYKKMVASQEDNDKNDFEIRDINI